MNKQNYFRGRNFIVVAKQGETFLVLNRDDVKPYEANKHFDGVIMEEAKEDDQP